MNTITLRAELILVFSFLLCLQGVQCVSKSNDQRNEEEGGFKCIYRGTVYGAETGSIIWRCGLEDVVYRTTVNCSIGKVHHCSLIRQRFTKPSECQGVIHRGNWIYKKSENKCAREPGPFSEEKECQKCVTVYERSPCNCTIDKGQKVDISCPKWKPLLSQYNFTYNAKIHATQYRRDLLGWCGSKETHDEIKGALRDQIDSCKHTSCQLQTVETIYQMIENITSQPNGDQLAPIAQQVQFVGDAVGLLRRKDALDYDVIIPLATSLLRSSDNIVNTLHQNFSERNDLSHKLIGHLEHVTPLMVKALENSEKQFTFTSRNIGMAVTSTNFTPSHTSKVEVFDANGGRTAKLTLYGPGKSQNRTCSGGCSGGVGIVVLKNVSHLYPIDVDPEFLDRVTSKDEPAVRLVSSVLSAVAVMGGRSIHHVNGTFALSTDNINKESTYCVYWDKKIASPNHGAWSSEGLKLILNKQNITECWTSHLTNFAVLVQTVHLEIPAIHALALEMITYIGCTIGLICLFVSVLIFSLLFRSLSGLRHRIHLNICVVLAVAQIVFLAGINATDNKAGCTIVAVLLHYFYTAAFAWMFVEGVHLYFMVVHVYNTQTLKIRYYMLFGWGFPFVFVGVSLASGFEGYGTDHACWISIETGLIWAFVVPVIIFNSINIVILVKVLYILVSIEESPLTPEEGKRARVAIRGVITLMPLLGLTWMFGILCVNTDTVAFQYLFAILNTLQGVFVFGFHCVGNSQVRSSLKKYVSRKWQVFSVLRSRPPRSRSTGRTTRGQETLGEVKNGTTADL